MELHSPYLFVLRSCMCMVCGLWLLLAWSHWWCGSVPAAPFEGPCKAGPLESPRWSSDLVPSSSSATLAEAGIAPLCGLAFSTSTTSPRRDLGMHLMRASSPRRSLVLRSLRTTFRAEGRLERRDASPRINEIDPGREARRELEKEPPNRPSNREKSNSPKTTQRTRYLHWISTPRLLQLPHLPLQWKLH